MPPSMPSATTSCRPPSGLAPHERRRRDPDSLRTLALRPCARGARHVACCLRASRRAASIADDQYAYEGRLAEKWDISSDGRTFTFTLRKGLKWSDGAPFTSKDVLFTYKLLANEASGSAQAAKFNNVKGVAEIRAGSDAPGFRAPDDSTFI